MLGTRLQGRAKHGCGVQFSPFDGNLIACSASENYGISGSGTLYALECDPTRRNGLRERWHADWTNALFDVAWSETDPNAVVTASGDTSLQMWKTTTVRGGPQQIYAGHRKEVASVRWNPIRTCPQHFVSGSWDGCVILWDPCLASPLANFVGHREPVYSVAWSPTMPETFSSVSGDCTLRIWSARSPNPMHSIRCHDADVLTCDWSKYDGNLVFTGSVDGLVRGWDLRFLDKPAVVFLGHEMGVRQVKASPYDGHIVASCSYDFSVRLWNIADGCCLAALNHHKEFTIGLDFNPHVNGEIGDCSWDKQICVYKPL